MATNAVTDPASTAVWRDDRVDPLSWRWHGPALGIAAAMALATAIVALSDGLSVRDTDKMLSARSAGLIAAVAFFVALDLLPRALMRGGRIDRAIVAVARERWNRRRLAAVGLGLLSFYVTYLSYRNLKGFLPFLTDQDYDPDLLSLDRTFFFGHDPGPFLHSLLGTGLAAQVLSTVYLFFLAFVPISLGAALIASANPIPGLWYVTALGINWTLGIVSYLMIPSLGPIFVAPDLYSTLPETGTSALQQALVYERHEALAGGGAQSIAAFASLHVSVVFTAALIAQLLKVNRVLRYALWAFLGLTMVATLYFGWHYVVDDLAGLAIGAIAVPIAGVATGHLRPAVPLRWRPMVPNALTARPHRDGAADRVAADRERRGVDARGDPVRDRLAVGLLRRLPRPPLERRERVRHAAPTRSPTSCSCSRSLGALAAAGSVPWWIFGLVGARELWVTVLRAQARRHGGVVCRRPAGQAQDVRAGGHAARR